MNPTDIAIVAVVVVLCIFAARRAFGTATGKRDCCSGELREVTRDFPRANIADTDESHYPYQADYTVEGMSCKRCAQRVENALNSVAGTWASVDLEAGRAHVRSKEAIDTDAYRKAVRDAGYTINVALVGDETENGVPRKGHA